MTFVKHLKIATPLQTSIIASENALQVATTYAEEECSGYDNNRTEEQRTSYEMSTSAIDSSDHRGDR